MSASTEEYLGYLAALRSLSPRTVVAYRDDLRLYEDSCASRGKAMEAAEPEDVRAFVAGLVTAGYATSSINRALSAVKGFYRYLLRYRKAAANPAKDVESLPLARTLPKFLFEEEMADFLALASGDGFRAARDRALLETLYSTGCRVSELSGLDLAAVDLGSARARVMGKGSKERVVFLSEPALEALRDWLPYRLARLGGGGGDPDALFLNARGGRLSTRGVAYIIERYALRSGLGSRVSPHAFRHSFATHLVGRGAGLRVVQELLGHENLSTTQIYTHVDMRRLREVYDGAHPHAREGGHPHARGAAANRAGAADGQAAPGGARTIRSAKAPKDRT